MVMGTHGCWQPTQFSGRYMGRKWICSQWWLVSSGKGAMAWIIEGCTSTNRIIRTGLSPCAEDGNSSFQSKLAGIYVTLFTLSFICPETGNQPTFWLACNGKSILQQLQRTHITDPTELHSNLLSGARYLIQHSGITVKLHHVKGHQDSKCFSPFTRDATLNIEVDHLAWGTLENIGQVHQCSIFPGVRVCAIQGPNASRKHLQMKSATTLVANEWQNTGSSSES